MRRLGDYTFVPESEWQSLLRSTRSFLGAVRRSRHGLLGLVAHGAALFLIPQNSDAVPNSNSGTKKESRHGQQRQRQEDS